MDDNDNKYKKNDFYIGCVITDVTFCNYSYNRYHEYRITHSKEKLNNTLNYAQ